MTKAAAIAAPPVCHSELVESRVGRIESDEKRARKPVLGKSQSLPAGWTTGAIENLFAPLEDGRTLHQGWSPQCETEPSPAEEVWGVLKTTSIQAGEFQPEHNTRLPDTLEPRPLIEVKEGDILLTCAGPRVRCGVACLVRRTRKRLMMSGKMYRFRVDPKRNDARYVEAFLQTEQARQAIDKMKTGGSDSGLNLTHARFRQLVVPVAPLPEQRRIVAEIEKQFTRLEAGVAALRRVQANLKRYRAAVLKAACEGRLVPTEAVSQKSAVRGQKSAANYETGEQLLQRILEQRRENWAGKGKYKEPAAPDTTGLPKLPDGWCWATVDQLSTRVVDGVHKKPDYVASGIPFVTVRNLTAGPGIDFENIRYITKAQHDEYIKRAHPEKGDILVSKDGTLGVIRVITMDTVFSIFVSVAMIKPVQRFMSAYLGITLCSPQVQAQMTPKGSGLVHIHLEDLRLDCIPLPPLAEQERIVAEVERRLSVVEELSALVESNLRRASRLRQSILQRAFEGKLTAGNER